MRHIIILVLFHIWTSHAESPYLQIINKEILDVKNDAYILRNGQLNQIYNDTIFNTQLNCRNGNLKIINNSNSQIMRVHYLNFGQITRDDTTIISLPNQAPISKISQLTPNQLQIDFNCPSANTQNNYWNKITITIKQKQFSFLLNCDPSYRHKQFQYGYLIISLINAMITIGVAMYSHIWSIKINLRPLRYQLKWIPFLTFSVLGIAFLLTLIFFAYNDFIQVFTTIKFLGIFVAFFFVFLCFNEIYYLNRTLRRPLFKSFRICELFSICSSTTLTILACFYENWIFYDILAGFICVGSIKIFHFKSLKQAFLSMTIMVLTVTALAIGLNNILPFSYNDYATQLSSPLFIQVPDLVNNLFKKCSWLPVFDVILPGVTLSYLRLYDQNKSSKCGGVYTVSGNLAFILSTIIWISSQFFYVYSVPFSLITYTSLMFVIFVISWRRNDWHTLLYGLFQQGYDTIHSSVLAQNKKSFSKHITEDVMRDVLIYTFTYSDHQGAQSVLTAD